VKLSACLRRFEAKRPKRSLISGSATLSWRFSIKEGDDFFRCSCGYEKRTHASPSNIWITGFGDALAHREATVKRVLS